MAAPAQTVMTSFFAISSGVGRAPAVGWVWAKAGEARHAPKRAQVKRRMRCPLFSATTLTAVKSFRKIRFGAGPCGRNASVALARVGGEVLVVLAFLPLVLV